MAPGSFFSALTRVDAHHRLGIAVGIAAGVWVALIGHSTLVTHVFATWNSFSFVVLALAWLRILSADPRQVRKTARLEDSSRTGIFIFVVVSACASLLALCFLLATARDLAKPALAEHVLVSLFTVLQAWLLVHTMFVLRYAHLYYAPGDGKGGTHAEGLQFPGGKQPDYLDFAYFSFIIGMTCQVSDVSITSREIRRLALIHGVVSFAFNTAILAFSFNVASSLL